MNGWVTWAWANITNNIVKPDDADHDEKVLEVEHGAAASARGAGGDHW